MTLIDEIMTREVRGIHVEETLRSALELFRAEEVSGAPVMQDDRVVGVVSLTDLSEFAATTSAVPTERPDRTEWGEFESPEVWVEGADSPSAYFVDFWSDVGAEITSRFEGSDSPEWDVFEEHTVAEIMTREVVGVSPSASIRDAAKLMADAEVQRVLVLDGAELKGIVSASDIVRAVADGRI